MKKASVISEAFLMMILLQTVKILLERVINPLVPGSSFSKRMVTMSLMIFLAGAVTFYALVRKKTLSVFPEKFSKKYIFFTCVAALLLISTPSNFTGGYQAILLLFYGSIVTPVYEELIFRGYLWNRLNSVLSKELFTYIWSVALFTVWHIGYMLPQVMSGNWNAVIWKLAAGVGYGAVLGFIRIKTKNCYSTMLVHGIINIFMV